MISVVMNRDKDAGEEPATLEDKIRQLAENLCREKRGEVYSSMLQALEKPLLEYVLERTEGNQLKAARLLGMNRNTLRTKIKKLGIVPERYKEI